MNTQVNTFRNREEAIKAIESSQLTSRERDLIKLACQGLSNAAIAKRLDLDLGTIKVYMSHLYKKLGYTREQAPRIALMRQFGTSAQ